MSTTAPLDGVMRSLRAKHVPQLAIVGGDTDPRLGEPFSDENPCPGCGSGRGPCRHLAAPDEQGRLGYVCHEKKGASPESVFILEDERRMYAYYLPEPQGQDAGDNADKRRRVEVVTRAWPAINDAALHGVAGDIVRAILPHSEADPAVLLGTLLVFCGNVVGHTPHALAAGSRHTGNEFTAIVGSTSKGRKGSSLGPIRQLFKEIDLDWSTSCITAGLSSGEGLTAAVRDPIEKITKDGVQVEPGVEDKRLLVIEEEMASTLKVMGREGNTLSAVVRQAWDHGDLSTLTKTPMRATGAHISIIGHITEAELQRQLTETDAANGFANRFLWLCSRRSQPLPEGGGTPDYGDTLAKLQRALAWARGRSEPMRRDDDARHVWARVYGPLSEGKPGLLGAVVGRAEAHVLRYSVLYALLDESPVVRVEHLHAALALWDYAEASARYIFGDRLGDPIADAILAGLRDVGATGLDKTGIHNLFGRNQPTSRIQVAVAQLSDCGLITASREVPNGGERTTTVYRIATTTP